MVNLVNLLQCRRLLRAGKIQRICFSIGRAKCEVQRVLVAWGAPVREKFFSLRSATIQSFFNSALLSSLFLPTLSFGFPPLPPSRPRRHGASLPYWLTWTTLKRLWRLVCRKPLDRNVCWKPLSPFAERYDPDWSLVPFSSCIRLWFISTDTDLSIRFISTHKDVSELYRYSRCATLMSSIATCCRLEQ